MLVHTVSVRRNKDIPTFHPQIYRLLPRSDSTLHLLVLGLRPDRARTFYVLRSASPVPHVRLNALPFSQLVHERIVKDHVVVLLARWVPTIYPANFSCLDTETNLVPQRAFLALFPVKSLAGGQRDTNARAGNGQQAVITYLFFLPISEKITLSLSPAMPSIKGHTHFRIIWGSTSPRRLHISVSLFG